MSVPSLSSGCHSSLHPRPLVAECCFPQLRLDPRIQLGFGEICGVWKGKLLTQRASYPSGAEDRVFLLIMASLSMESPCQGWPAPSPARRAGLNSQLEHPAQSALAVTDTERAERAGIPISWAPGTHEAKEKPRDGEEGRKRGREMLQCTPGHGEVKIPLLPPVPQHKTHQL